jgi:hypothetical protein
MSRGRAGGLVAVAALTAAVVMAAGAARADVMVVADGLDNPRGVAVSWGGRVFVAEAGHGGDRRVDWPAPVGYAMVGDTGRVSMLVSGRFARFAQGAGGTVPIVTGLPSVALGDGGQVVGAAGLAFRGSALFAAMGSAVPGFETAAAARRITGRWRAAWQVNTWPTITQSDLGGGAAESNPYGLAFDRGPWAMYLADAGANALLRGRYWRYAPEVVKAWDDDPVPTAVAVGPDGYFYVAMFSHYPFASGSARIERVDADGESQVVASGLTALTDLQFDRAGRLYAVQFGEFDGKGWLPNTGAILRIEPDGQPTVIAGDLSFPNKMAFGHRGELYVTVNSAYSPPYSGKLVMIAGVGPGERWTMGRY